MPLTNSQTTYGAVTKTFHWTTALLILTTIPLGYFASDLAHQIAAPEIATTEAQVARATLLFTIHKTIGVSIFFLALARILWAATQPKPDLLNGDNPPEAWLAETVHWLLYGSLVAVPLSGWVYHAATTGFAPIWWPFGQDLPFVPKDETWASVAKTLHYLLQWVLIGAVALHVTGALKHHVIDRDATLRRMLPGYTPGEPTDRQPGHVLPVLSALAIWAVVLGGAGALGWFGKAEGGRGTALAQVESEWQVQQGILEITVTQMGSEVQGSFADWTADISYAPAPDAAGQHGEVTVTIAIGSLTLGSVTDQAMGEDFFNAEDYPTATFTADLLSTGEGRVARGKLTIKGESVPVDMPFDLQIEGDTARASGGLTVDRRKFDIGQGVSDPDTLAYKVDVRFELTASRG